MDMNDAERLRVLVRALLPFALAAERNAYLSADSLLYYAVRDNDRYWHYPVLTGDDALHTADLRAAAAALRATGYADALTDDSARAALGGEE